LARGPVPRETEADREALTIQELCNEFLTVKQHEKAAGNSPSRISGLHAMH